MSNIDKIQKFFLVIIEIEVQIELCYDLLNWLSKRDIIFFYLFA